MITNIIISLKIYFIMRLTYNFIMEKINISKHVKYFNRLAQKIPEEAHSSYMTALFFIISGKDILNDLDNINKQEIIDWIYTQQNSYVPYAGFRPNPSTIQLGSSMWDYSSLASTYSALCALKILGDDLSKVNKSEIMQSIKFQICEDGCALSHPNGIEKDMRFVYCACAICYILNSWEDINKELLTSYILSCQTYEGNFSLTPGHEGHGGATYCAVSSLYLLDTLKELSRKDELIQWLVLRQGNGFQGRPGKAEDTCYGYWIGLSLQILEAEEFINKEDNIDFYSECESSIGGFSKFPSGNPDPTHSYLGLWALTLLGVKGLKRLFAPLGISINKI